MSKIPKGIIILAIGVIAGATLPTGATVAIEAGAGESSTSGAVSGS